MVHSHPAHQYRNILAPQSGAAPLVLRIRQPPNLAVPVARGCRDILPPRAAHRRHLISKFAELCRLYNIHEIETPIIEASSIFSHMGRTSDVLTSQMFHIASTTPALALRPEGTAGVARALRGTRGARVWYSGAMFRHERPQRLRYRQFWQLGVEFVEEDTADSDAEVIKLAADYLAGCSVRNELRVNTLGGKSERKRYNEALGEFLKDRYWAVSNESRRRIEEGNCMRVLDSKLTEDVDALVGAPRLGEFVGGEERDRFEGVCERLREGGVKFRVDERLVRGLDYYTGVAFEFDGEGGRAVCAGGRYEQVQGVGGVGFAIGLDRMEGETGGIEEMTEKEASLLVGGVVVVGLGDGEVGKVVREVVRGFRERGVVCVGWMTGSKVGKAVGRGVKEGAACVVVIGEREIREGEATVKKICRGGEVCEPVRIDISEVHSMVQHMLPN